jgi:hypothetical protein
VLTVRRFCSAIMALVFVSRLIVDTPCGIGQLKNW